MQQSALYSNIQLLRAIAATMVVAVHSVAGYLLMGGKSSLYPTLAWHGMFGVDIFFVISGFVIGATTLHKPRTVLASLDFFRRRALRIYLGYWPFFLWALVQTWFLAQDRLENINFWGSFFLMEPHFMKSLLSVAWSLSYELYFYLLFSLLFVFSRDRTVLIVHLLFVLVLIRASCFPLAEGGYLSFLTSAYLLEFLAGVLLFIHIDHLKSRLWMFLCVGVFCIFITVAFQQEPDGQIRVFSYGPAALALVMFMVLLEKRGTYKSGKLGMLLGDASYTLYLAHSLLIKLFVLFVVLPFLTKQSGLLPELLFFGGLISILALCTLGYIYVEKPLFRWAVRKTSHLPENLVNRIQRTFPRLNTTSDVKRNNH